MKIAFIVDEFPSLSETFILNQITGLINLGHQVEIFAGTRPQESKAHPEIAKLDLLSHTHLLNQEPENRFIRFTKACGLFLSKGYKNPLAILRSLNFFAYGKEAFSLNLFYKVILFLVKGDFDIIQCHFGPNGITGALLKGMGIKGKIVTTFHGYDMCKYIRQKGEDVYKDLFSKGDFFLPISNYWRKKLVQLGCPQGRTMVHYMGIDIEKFKFRPRQLSSFEDINILTVARLTGKKGLNYSIRAVAKVIKRKPNIEYNIIGDGPLNNELKRLICSLGVGRQVKLLGWKIGEELEKALENAHLFLLHSVTDADGNMEGIPVSLMEAQAVGLPVISTYHSGIPELVQNGKPGFLVPERDVDAMAEKIEYLIERPEIWPKMGRVGRKIIEDKFNIKKLNQRLVEIYQSLI